MSKRAQIKYLIFLTLAKQIFSCNITTVNNFTSSNEVGTNKSKCNFDNSTIFETFKKEWPVKQWEALGLFNDKNLEDINIHWLKFSPPKSTSFYAIGVTYIFLLSGGFTGNVLVLYMVYRCKSLRTPANTLTVNLAISDGLMMIKTPIFIFNSFFRGPALGDYACRIYGFVGGLTGVVSICTLAAISLDRYFVIKFPLARNFTNSRVKVCLLVAWTYGLVFSIIPVLDIGLGKYTYEGYLISCSFDYLSSNQAERIFILTFFVAAWILPFSIITFSYVNIIQVVSQRSISGKKERESFRHVKEEDKRRQEVKLAMVVLGVIFLWVAAWTPYSVVALLGIAGKHDQINQLTSMIPALFCKTTSIINPFVYAISNQKFKDELINLFFGKKKRENRKIWTTEPSQKRFECNKSSNAEEVEEETVEVELKEITAPTVETVSTVKASKSQVPEIQRQSSLTQLLCLRPSFSNKTSSIRKMARRWSMKEREKREQE